MNESAVSIKEDGTLFGSHAPFCGLIYVDSVGMFDQEKVWTSPAENAVLFLFGYFLTPLHLFYSYNYFTNKIYYMKYNL